MIDINEVKDLIGDEQAARVDFMIGKLKGNLQTVPEVSSSLEVVTLVPERLKVLLVRAFVAGAKAERIYREQQS